MGTTLVRRYSRRRRRIRARVRFLIAATLIAAFPIAYVALNEWAQSRSAAADADETPQSAVPAVPMSADAERPVFPYSVIPGGAQSVQELAQAIETDPVVKEHFTSFDLAKTIVTTLPAPRLSHVSYRIGERVYWTRHPHAIPAGERVLTDGVRVARTRCGNQLAEVPGETSVAEPPASVLDTPLPLKPASKVLLAPPPLQRAAGGAAPVVIPPSLAMPGVSGPGWGAPSSSGSVAIGIPVAVGLPPSADPQPPAGGSQPPSAGQPEPPSSGGGPGPQGIPDPPPGPPQPPPGGSDGPPGNPGVPPGPPATPPGNPPSPPGGPQPPPGDDGVPPGDDGVPPGDDGVPPGDDGLPPGDDGVPPGDDGVPPGDDLPPGDDGVPPGGTVPEPGTTLLILAGAAAAAARRFRNGVKGNPSR